jgi:hypothetical protein
MTIRPLSAILADLSATMKTLAERHIPPISLHQEFAITDRALLSGNEAQVFRVLELLVFTAHEFGLAQENPAYDEAVQVLTMSNRPLPTDI